MLHRAGGGSHDQANVSVPAQRAGIKGNRCAARRHRCGRGHDALASDPPGIDQLCRRDHRSPRAGAGSRAAATGRHRQTTRATVMMPHYPGQDPGQHHAAYRYTMDSPVSVVLAVSQPDSHCASQSQSRSQCSSQSVLAAPAAVPGPFRYHSHSAQRVQMWHASGPGCARVPFRMDGGAFNATACGNSTKVLTALSTLRVPLSQSHSVSLPSGVDPLQSGVTLTQSQSLTQRHSREDQS